MTRYLPITFLGLTLLFGSLACAPKTVGPTSPSGYVFSLTAFPPGIAKSSSLDSSPDWSLYERSAELIVVVQDAQGQPVENVPVAFELPPAWEHDAEVTPSRTLTRHGRANARFQASIIGAVSVLARVENTTQQVTIAVSAPGSAGGNGGGD